MKASRRLPALAAAVLAVAAVAIAGRSLSRRGDRAHDALKDRMSDVAEAAALADRVIALERVRDELRSTVASAAVPDLAAWIRSLLPEGTSDQALAAVGVLELPGAEILAATYRVSLDDITLEQAVALLCDLHEARPPVAVAVLDLTPGTAAPRFSLALEIVAYTAAGTPGS